MNVSRDAVIKALVWPLVIVKMEVGFQSSGKGRQRVVVFDVNVFVFDGPPEPLNEDIIKDASPAIHADLNISGSQFAGKIVGGELNTLVGVENLGLCLPQRQAQSRQAKSAIQAVK
jgi:hypothetical protein